MRDKYATRRHPGSTSRRPRGIATRRRSVPHVRVSVCARRSRHWHCAHSHAPRAPICVERPNADGSATDVAKPRAQVNVFTMPSPQQKPEKYERSATRARERLAFNAASRLKVQARCGGPRDVCWRIGPKVRRVCVKTVGGTNRSIVAPAASAGKVGNGAGPALCAYGQVGSTCPC